MIIPLILCSRHTIYCNFKDSYQLEVIQDIAPNRISDYAKLRQKLASYNIISVFIMNHVKPGRQVRKNQITAVTTN